MSAILEKNEEILNKMYVLYGIWNIILSLNLS